jgi:hypothetical protein
MFWEEFEHYIPQFAQLVGKNKSYFQIKPLLAIILLLTDNQNRDTLKRSMLCSNHRIVSIYGKAYGIYPDNMEIICE